MISLEELIRRLQKADARIRYGREVKIQIFFSGKVDVSRREQIDLTMSAQDHEKSLIAFVKMMELYQIDTARRNDPFDMMEQCYEDPGKSPNSLCNECGAPSNEHIWPFSEEMHRTLERGDQRAKEAREKGLCAVCQEVPASPQSRICDDCSKPVPIDDPNVYDKNGYDKYGRHFETLIFWDVEDIRANTQPWHQFT